MVPLDRVLCFTVRNRSEQFPKVSRIVELKTDRRSAGEKAALNRLDNVLRFKPPAQAAGKLGARNRNQPMRVAIDEFLLVLFVEGMNRPAHGVRKCSW